MASYGMTIKMNGTLDEVKPRVVEALKTQGFGVLTEIDVQKTLQQKIGVDFKPYLILGAGAMCMNLERGAFNNAPVHDDDRTEFAGRGGLGFDFYLFDDVVLFGEATYVQATGALADYPFAAFAFGAQYRFP